MRRAALFVSIAALALVLVYPSATPSARSPALQDQSIIQVVTPESNGQIPAFTGDGGDADDLAGLKGRNDKPSGSPLQSDFVIQARLAAKVWRMHLFVFGLYR